MARSRCTLLSTLGGLDCLLELFAYIAYCVCGLRRKGVATRQSQVFPACAGGPFPHLSSQRHHATGRVLRRWRAGIPGRINPRIDIGVRAPACSRPFVFFGALADTLQWFAFQASGLFVSLSVRRAVCTPGALRVCNSASREGGLQCLVQSSYRASCHGEAASLVIGCAADPTLSCGLLYLSFGLLT